MKCWLSICIPTFNRSATLNQTLESIVSQDIFQNSDEVEIVISDNASTDNTPEIAGAWQQKYPDKIHYFRLADPIDPHFNFQSALSKGRGHFLKLHTDATTICPGELGPLVRRMKLHENAAAIITDNVLCASDADRRDLEFHDIDGILKYCTLSLTTITLYCFNREKYLRIPDPFRFYQLFFPHEDILFHMIESGETAVVLDGPFYNWLPKRYIKRNDAHIFGHCYLQLLQMYVQKRLITPAGFRREKKRAYFMAILPNYFDFRKQILSEPCQGYRVFWNCMDQYRNEPYFYLSLPCIAVYRTLCDIPALLSLADGIRALFLKTRGGTYAKRIALDEKLKKKQG